MRRLIATLTLAGSVTLAQAATITVHNTGVGLDDALVAPGSATAFWTLTDKPAESSLALGSTPFRYRHPAYAADTAAAAWVSPTAAGNAGVVDSHPYRYVLSVDLTGFDPTTAVITGRFTSDNDGSISLNYQYGKVQSTYAGYGTFNSFTFDEGFVAGINEIVVEVVNAGDPTAFIVEFTSATAEVQPVPVPGALGLLAGGLVALGALRRKHQG